MFKNSKAIAFSVLAACLTFVTGCSANFQNTYTRGIDYPAATTKDAVAICKRGEPIDGIRPHQILGKVYVQKRGATIFSKPSEKHLLKLMQDEAAGKGADALIDAHSSLHFGKETNAIKRWASALAIKYVDDGRQIIPADFVICVPPVINMDTDDPKQCAEDDAIIRGVAQNMLEKLGYYGMTSEQFMTPEKILAMEPDELGGLGSADARFILCLTLGKTGGVNVGVIGTKSTTLHAELISKETRLIVWRNTDSGSDFTLGLVNTLVGGHRKRSMFKAAKEVMETLAPYQATTSQAYGSI
jgi:hypothetical protein